MSANPGDSFRKIWTAKFANEIRSFMDGASNVTGSGQIFVSGSKKKGGTQISIPQPRAALSTLQGVLTGGAAPAVTNGTDILDPYAWAAYSIQGAAFILNAGTCTVDVFVDGTEVSWLMAIAVDAFGIVIPIPVPPPDLTHVIPVGSQLSIQISSSSSDASGLAFTLNVPF